MSEPTSEARRRQIARELRSDIEAGRLRPGERLPSSRALASQWHVGVGTVNQAMEELTNEGLVVSRPRSGRVVAERPDTSAVRVVTRPRAVLVGGYAGSGKTEAGRILARQTGWAMIDKDTITRGVVDAALVQMGSSVSDRESATYIEVVRPAEYQCLEATMLENISCGVSVIATAPYLREFTSVAWFERLHATLAGLGADLSVLWLRASPASMRSYIERRGAARDSWKLGHWDQYVASIDADFAPQWPHTVIDNDPTDEPLQGQLAAWLRTLESA